MTEPALHMLETVRTYAEEKLGRPRPRRDRAAAQRVGAGDGAAFWQARGHDYRGARAFDRERANLRAAVQRAIDAGDVATVALLAGTCSPTSCSATPSARRWPGWSSLELPTTGATAVRGRLLVLWALARASRGTPTRCAPASYEGWRLLPDDAEHAYDQAAAAIAAVYEALARDPEEAPGLIQQAADRFAALGHSLGQAHVELAAGDLALSRG